MVNRPQNRIWCDIFWHPLNNGLRFQRTHYAYYISLFHLQINIPRTHHD